MANFLNFEKSITHYVNKFFHEFESRQLENFLNFLAKNVIEYARLLLDYYSIHSQSNWPVIFAIFYISRRKFFVSLMLYNPFNRHYETSPKSVSEF